MHKDDENVELEISLTCKIQVVDHDLNSPQSYQENACNSFKVYLKENSNDSENTTHVGSLQLNDWKLKHDYFIYEIDQSPQKNSIVKIIKLKNLSSSTNYSMKIELELYSLSFGSNPASNVLQTDEFSFVTDQSTF